MDFPELENKERLTRTGNSFEVSVCKSAFCRRSLYPFSDFLERVTKIFEEKGYESDKPLLSHAKFKVAASGCPNACSQVHIKDFGVIAFLQPEIVGDCIYCGKCEDVCRENGVEVDEVVTFNENCIGCGDCMLACPQKAIGGDIKFRILVGGKLGRKPRLAEELAVVDSIDDVYRILERAIEVSKERGRRLSMIIDDVRQELI